MHGAIVAVSAIANSGFLACVITAFTTGCITFESCGGPLPDVFPPSGLESGGDIPVLAQLESHTALHLDHVVSMSALCPLARWNIVGTP